MLKAVIFDEFASVCPFFDSSSPANNGYGCKHTEQKEIQEEDGKLYGCCFCHSCPLGIEAEQEDWDEQMEKAISERSIDWDDLCDDGDVAEGEYLLVQVGEDSSEDEKSAMESYEHYLHRYDQNRQ